MKIVSVKDEQYSRYIPLKGWQSLEAAVNTYANGFVRGSRATEKKLVDDITESRGDLAGVFCMFASAVLGDQNRSGFVGSMLSEAKAALVKRDRWRKHYDYDGMGTAFFKTSVEVKVLDREVDLYGLGINAAYVGDQPESELAEYLGTPRTLLRSTVIAQTRPVGTDRFAFDFEQIIRDLDSVLATEGISGGSVAQIMMETDQYGESKASFTFEEKEGFSVSLFPNRVAHRFDWVDPFGPGRRQVDTWSVDGAVLSGLLDNSYEDRTKKEPPSFAISISDRRKTDYGDENIPIWDEDKKDYIILLTDAIVKALR